MTVDGLPAVHTCVTTCLEGMRVERSGGWPSAERDVLHVTDSLHRVMPVGFYYKTFIRPRFAWPVAERVIRRATGLGALPETTAAARHVVHHEHVEVLVIGAGIAGLEAARDAVSAGAPRCSCATRAGSANGSRRGRFSIASARSRPRCGRSTR